ncbi:MAG: hypothetical protein RLZZ385_637 [Pseudomonadota bacterium]|jgi:cell division protein FtsB
MIKAISTVLLLFLLVLQYQIWFGRSSLTQLDALRDELQVQRELNGRLQERNQELEVEILDLKNGLEAVEERARSELGMIGENETFYLIIE